MPYETMSFPGLTRFMRDQHVEVLERANRLCHGTPLLSATIPRQQKGAPKSTARTLMFASGHRFELSASKKCATKRREGRTGGIVASAGSLPGRSSQ